jgi:hypothetical protein
MKKGIVFFMSLLILHDAQAENTRVRKLALESDQIAQVKTALGIATIIQVPDIPNCVVVGDSEGFKVEYLDQAITVKPLYSGAKSNLYIYTDYRRYNVQLIAGSQDQANFIVYLEPAKSLKKKGNPVRVIEPRLTGIRWWKLYKRLNYDDLVFTLKRVGLSSNEVILFEFQIGSQKPTEIKPSSFTLKQKGDLVTIHNLFLSNLKIDSKTPVSGTIEILKSDLKLNSTIQIEMKRIKTSSLTIQEVTSFYLLKKK